MVVRCSDGTGLQSQLNMYAWQPVSRESSHVAGQGEVIIRTRTGSGQLRREDTSLLLIVPLAHVARRATGSQYSSSVNCHRMHAGSSGRGPSIALIRQLAPRLVRETEACLYHSRPPCNHVRPLLPPQPRRRQQAMAEIRRPAPAPAPALLRFISRRCSQDLEHPGSTRGHHHGAVARPSQSPQRHFAATAQRAERRRRRLA